MKIIILFIIYLSSGILSAQPIQLWVNRYNGTGNGSDYGNKLNLDKYGNIYVAGYSEGLGTENDLVTIKYNFKGEMIWTQRYNCPGSYSGYGIGSIGLDNNCNVYILGESCNGLSTLKYDSSGNIKWARYYGIPETIDCIGSTVLPDDSGNVYSFGEIFTTGFDNGGYFLIKYDSSGATKWVRRYITDGFPANMVLDSRGNIYICGSAYIATVSDYLIIKYNSNGDSIWTRTFNSPSFHSYPTALAVDISGNVYVTGESGGSPFVYWTYKYTTIKYDENGNRLWVRQYDGLGNDGDVPQAIALDNAGNVYVTGYSSGRQNTFEYATIKYNSDGDSLWVRRYNGGERQYMYEANSIAVDAYGNSYVTGSSMYYNSQSDYVTVKYSPSGQLLWTSRYNGTANSNDEANMVKLDLAGNVYVTGSSNGVGSGPDFVTIKYSQEELVGIHSESSKLPLKFELFQNYPNPFNPVTKIHFDLTEDSRVKLIVYDLLGQEVKNIVNSMLRAGRYEYDFEGNNIASGIYFYRLEAVENSGERFVKCRSMVLAK